MNWDALGAIAELVGALAVVASLLYIAVQVRAGTRASRVQSKLESVRLLNDFIDSMIKNPELNALWNRGRKDLESLPQEEYLRFSNMCLKGFWFFSAGYFQYREGSLDDEDWYELRAVIRFWLRGRGVRAWWATVGRVMYGKQLVEFIDAEITKLEAQMAQEKQTG